MCIFSHKHFVCSFLLTILIFLVTQNQKSKGATTVVIAPCSIKGTYTGKGTSSTGATGPLSYTMKGSHLIVGSITPNGSLTTFGWYNNTCDSIFIYDWYTVNNSFYYLNGKITKSRLATTISGAFKNLTNPSDHGTFIMSK